MKSHRIRNLGFTFKDFTGQSQLKVTQNKTIQYI